MTVIDYITYKEPRQQPCNERSFVRKTFIKVELIKMVYFFIVKEITYFIVY